MYTAAYACTQIFMHEIVNFGVVFYIFCVLWQNAIYIFGGFHIGGQCGVALYLADDGQAVDGAPLVLHHRGAHFDDLLLGCVPVLWFAALAVVGIVAHRCAPSFLP